MKAPSLSQRMGNAVDAAVGVFSPLRGLQRQMARQTMARLGNRNAYDGAAKERRWHNRAQSSGSADADLDGDVLATLRERSRDRVRNDGIATSAVNSLVDNVVGIGFRPVLSLPAKALGITDDRAKELQDQADAIWEDWGESCDLTGRLGIEDLQAQVFSQVLVNGDVVVLPTMRSDPLARYDLRLQIVEGDRLDTPLGKRDANIHAGVELNNDGRPVAYWITEEHPGDAIPTVGSRTFQRVPATAGGRPNALHIYVQDRPGQSRGCPVLAPVLDRLKDRDDYAETEIVAAQVAACFAAFVRKSDPYAAALARSTADTKGKSTREEELSPGGIVYLAPGEEVSFGNPTRPNANFDAFLRSITREVTSALGMPFEIATRDFSGTTYSQARAALLEARRLFSRRQRWLSRTLLTPVWRMLLEEAWARGDYGADGSFLERIQAWTRVVWVPPGWGWIDPQKELNAYETALKLRVMSRQQVVASIDGGNWEDTARKIADEHLLMRELDIEEQPDGTVVSKVPSKVPVDDEEAAQPQGIGA